MSPITPSVQCKHFSISCSASTASPEYLPLHPALWVCVCTDFRYYPRSPNNAEGIVRANRGVTHKWTKGEGGAWATGEWMVKKQRWLLCNPPHNTNRGESKPWFKCHTEVNMELSHLNQNPSWSFDHVHINYTCINPHIHSHIITDLPSCLCHSVCACLYMHTH